MDILKLNTANRIPRKQKGQRIETSTTWGLRYYVDGKQKFVTLAHKSDLYRSWSDVEPLIARVLEGVNEQAEVLTGQLTLSDFIEQHYLPWCRENKAAPTTNGYQKIWRRYWKPTVGDIALANLTTTQVTAVLTHHAKAGSGVRSLSHMKWFLSGVYGYAISSGVVPANPVHAAKWLVKVARVEKMTEYSLDQVLAMLRILEPLDLRCAVAVVLAYFAALRPAEIRGLMWPDYDGAELQIKRTVWRDVVGETKTEDSAASVPVIEPLRGLLEKLKAQSPDGYIMQSATGQPMSLDSLSTAKIAPAMKKAGIVWRGYYPCRRGISSLVTASSNNVLNSTGLLRHSNPSTTLKHYTQAQKASIEAALKTVEEMATKPEETIQ